MKLEAIKNVYPGACSVTDYGTHVEVQDAQGNPVTIDEQAVQAEITRLQADYAAKQYQRDRAAAYPSIPDQLDVIYHQGVDAWKEQIAAIKAAHPKPGV